MELKAEYLRSIIDFDAMTGIFKWKYRNDKQSWWNARYSGKLAGSPDTKGYVRIFINGERYLAHRLAWLYVHGHWPREQIDHKNRNRSDNRISNLRDVTQSENQRNKVVVMRTRRQGASFHKHSGKWLARIRIKGERVHLGYFDDKIGAENAYRTACNALGLKSA